MTNDEAQKVVQAMQGLNQFATTSNTLNTNAIWHDIWKQQFALAVQQIAALVDKPVDKSPDKKPVPPPVAPGKQGSKVVKSLVKKLGKKATPR
jgi:hypothetical protein